MTYIATALRRREHEWEGVDVDLGDVEDLDTLSEVVRDSRETAMLLLEEDDEYVGILRIEDDTDPRVFVSDRRVLEGDGLAARLFGESIEAEVREAPGDDAEDDEDSGRPEVEPAGDEALLTDLGVSGERLLDLCAEEGMLPSDVIFAVAEAIGAAEVLERVRGV